MGYIIIQGHNRLKNSRIHRSVFSYEDLVLVLSFTRVIYIIIFKRLHYIYGLCFNVIVPAINEHSIPVKYKGIS